MIPNRQDLIPQALESGSLCLDLLCRIDSVGDKLLDAIQSSSFDQLESLLQTREKICQQFGISSERFAALLLEATQKGDRNSGDLRELEALVEKLRATENDVIKKQAECEADLLAAMDNCRTEIGSFAQRRDLRETYQGSLPEDQARFLDSRR